MWAFNNIENKYSLYRGEDCRKKLCISLREMLLLIEKELKSHQDSTVC